MLLLLFFLLNDVLSFAQQESIQAVQIYQLKTSSNSTPFAEKMVEQQHFNSAGQLMVKQVWAVDHWQYYQYTYNEQQLLLTTTLTDAQGNLLLEWLYQYNEQGNKIAESYWVANQYVICTDFYYNEAHQLTATQKYWEEQIASQWTNYVYQDQHLQTFTQHNKYQEVQKSVHYQYDAKHRPYILTYFDNHNEIVQKQRHAYNSSNNIVATLRINEKGMPVYRQVNTYYKEVEKVSEIVYEASNHNWRQIYQKIFLYKENGLLSEIKQYNGKQELVAHWTYEYEFY